MHTHSHCVQNILRQSNDCHCIYSLRCIHFNVHEHLYISSLAGLCNRLEMVMVATMHERHAERAMAAASAANGVGGCECGCDIANGQFFCHFSSFWFYSILSTPFGFPWSLPFSPPLCANGRAFVCMCSFLQIDFCNRANDLLASVYILNTFDKK